MQPVSYRTFCRYWKSQLSHIVIGKPRSDLCWTCQQNSMEIMKICKQFRPSKREGTYAHHTHKDQFPTFDNSILLILMIFCSQIIDEAKVHLETVTMERSLYWNACKSSRDTLKAVFTAQDLLQPPSPSSYSPPKSHEMTVYYSFDMAQQVKYVIIIHTLHFTTNRFTIAVIHSSRD